MRAISLHLAGYSAALVFAAACGGEEGLTAAQLNAGMPPAASGTVPETSGGTTDPATTGEMGPLASPTETPTPGASMPPGVTSDSTQPPSGALSVQTGPTTGSTGGPTPAADPTGSEPEVEPLPDDPLGMGGSGADGTGGTGVGPVLEPDVSGGGMGSTGVGGVPVVPDPVPEPAVDVCEGPYCPRSGSFKMLAYSKTAGFRHGDSINTGKAMLQEIAGEQGFEITFTEANDEITPEGLAQYEIVFFMNSTGDIFSNNEQQIYEDWMTTQNGAFGGVHSATDTENGWAFYSEVTGQYYDLHEACCVEANIQWEADALGFVAVQGLPNPWRRSEEWYYFNRSAEWSTKAGFTILSRVTSNNNTRPVSFVREWGNFRSFYTSLGHQASTFQDADVKRHVAAGIMWAVRREAELQ